MTYAAKKVLVDDLFDDFFTDTGKGFLEWVYDILFGLEEEEIPADELIEGSGEQQIDVLRVWDDTAASKADVYILQTKKQSGFSANTVVLMGNGISTIFETPKADLKKLQNQALASKILEIRELLNKYGPGSVVFYVVYATLGNTDDVGKNTKSEINKITSKWSNNVSQFKFELLGASELYDRWWQKESAERNIAQDIEIVYDVNRPSIIEFNAETYKAVICTVAGDEIARLASVEPKDAIFDLNIRGHLGTAGRVNTSILDACTDATQAPTFWLKNNGITMVCDQVEVTKDPDRAILKVKGVQIVNGCQTSVTLREAKIAGHLQPSVRVLVKVFQLEEPDLINKIVLATNNQNSIVSRDLYANDESQTLIQQKIAQTIGYFYERKRGEGRSAGVSRSNIIDSEKAGQAYLAIKKKLPTISRAQKYRIYESQTYIDIFRTSNPLQLALCYFLYGYCKRNGAKQAKLLAKGDDQHSLLTYGVFHLARAFAYFVFSSEDMPTDEPEIITIIDTLQANPSYFDKEFERAIKLCLKTLNNAKAPSANNYFKSQAAQEGITRAIGQIGRSRAGRPHRSRRKKSAKSASG